MVERETSLFTVGVFQDVEWATRGIDALQRHGFPASTIAVLAKDSPEVLDLVRRALGQDGVAIDVPDLGSVVGAGPLLATLQAGQAGLSASGLAATMNRAGFQPHDGLIFARLTARGGVLVAVESAARASDALAVLHAFGGGNAAIGAWAGRL